MQAAQQPRSVAELQRDRTAAHVHALVDPILPVPAALPRHDQLVPASRQRGQVLDHIPGHRHALAQVPLLVHVFVRLGKPVLLSVAYRQVLRYHLQARLGLQDGLGLFRQECRRESVSSRGHRLLF